LGSTGWLKSLLTGAAAITQSAGTVLAQQPAEGMAKANRNQKGKIRLNVRTEFAWDANYLFFTVREPFPTHTTGASLVFGRVTSNPLSLQCKWRKWRHFQRRHPKRFSGVQLRNAGRDNC
jgi:hypothetical protein